MKNEKDRDASPGWNPGKKKHTWTGLWTLKNFGYIAAKENIKPIHEEYPVIRFWYYSAQRYVYKNMRRGYSIQQIEEAYRETLKELSLKLPLSVISEFGPNEIVKEATSRLKWEKPDNPQYSRAFGLY